MDTNSISKKYWCGAYWTPLWIKKILSKFFNEACYIHDKQYDERKLTRKEIDYQFLKNMLETSYRPYLAFVFFVFVRTLGWISYKGKK